MNRSRPKDPPGLRVLDPPVIRPAAPLAPSIPPPVSDRELLPPIIVPVALAPALAKDDTLYQPPGACTKPGNGA
jgi:hypothetical protein